MDDAAGGKYIRLNEEFSRSWRLVGRALDRGGFTVIDLDRSRGLFLVRYIDSDESASEERSWLSRLAFWSSSEERDPEDAEFRIVLESGGEARTRVVVQDEEGGRDASGSADRLLTVLAQQFG